MVRRLSMETKRDITKKYAQGYSKLSKDEKARVLDYLCATCGWTRKHAVKVLHAAREKQRPHVCVEKKRKRKYGDELRPVLERLWYSSGCQNTKSLHALLGVWYEKLKCFDELDGMELTKEQEDLLREMSESTLSRMLKPIRDANRLKGRSTTKAGTLLRNSIKVRKAGDEQEQIPGFIELDTVAHCGASLQGEFVRSLTATDVHTGWTEIVAIRNNAHSNIEKGLCEIEAAFPFPLKGFDCDNGSEFINKQIIEWVNERDLYFTRSRPYKKNDNAHVEQKNNDLVRRLAFYYRYDTTQERKLLNEIYKKARVFYNFFRAIQKTNGYREDKLGRNVRTYDSPRTPYQRVLDSGVLTQDKATELRKIYEQTNPAELMRQIVHLQCTLIELAKLPTDIEMKHEQLVKSLLGEVA